MAAPPTRTISFQQVVLEAEPDWQLSYTRPWIYTFSNGRRFYQTNPVYPPYDLLFLLGADGGGIIGGDGIGGNPALGVDG